MNEVRRTLKKELKKILDSEEVLKSLIFGRDILIKSTENGIKVQAYMPKTIKLKED